MADPKFIHLNVASKFSMCESLCDLKKLVKACEAENMPAIGISDVNMFNAPHTSVTFSGAGIQPILGQTIGLKRNEIDSKGNLVKPDYLVLIVQNEVGYKNLIKISSVASLEAPENEPAQIELDFVLEHNEGLICTTSSQLYGRAARLLNENKPAEAKEYIQKLKDAFGDRLYIELQRHGHHQELNTEADLVEFAYDMDIPLVATNNVRYIKQHEAEALDVLLCVKEGLTLSAPNRPSYGKEHYFKSTEEMLELFKDLPEAIENTVVIAKRCGYQVPMGTNYMPEWRWSPEGMSVDDDLRNQTIEGLEEHLKETVLPEHPPEKHEQIRKEYYDRMEYELGIIVQMGFSGYFLIVSDFCKWTLENGYPVGPGRGSGAGSLVAWSLKITGLDPIKYGLFFERFLNPERVSMPDFDIDFCQTNRGKTIDYVRRKYGDDHTAQIITFGSLKAKGCIRDVGRVMDLPYGLVNRIAGYIPAGPPDVPIAQALEEDERFKQEYESDEQIKELVDTAMLLEGALRNTSTHAAGVVITPRPIDEIGPAYRDDVTGNAVTQYDGKLLEDAGMIKFDFLGLKTLTTIDTILALVKELGVDIDINKIPVDDQKTFENLCTGHTMGIFQLESQGMQELVRKLQPEVFEDMTALVALYRPGPLGSGMVDTFVECRHGRQEVTYPHPKLEPILKETYGVILYQEQVMQSAQVLAGYTLGGADIMRRAMGKKKPEDMKKQREIFVSGSKEYSDVPEEKSNEIFDLIDKFSGYGFNKSHSLAYGYVSYQTAYLKAHYPDQFTAGSMTMDRGNTEKLVKYKQDFERMGGEILPPCINNSRPLFYVPEEKKIRFALAALKGGSEEAMKYLYEERQKNGPYKDIYDFISRQDPQYFNKRTLEVLVKSGGLDCIEPNRGLIHKNMDVLLSYMGMLKQERNSNQISLFGGGNDEQLEKPKLKKAIAWDPLEMLDHEAAALGFYISSHPLEAYQEDIEALGDIKGLGLLDELASQGEKRVKVVGIVLAIKEMKTKKGQRMGFVTLSDATGQQEVVLFPENYAKAYHLLREKASPVVMTLNMELEEEMLRLSVEGLVENLDSTGAGRQFLELAVNAQTPLEDLKNILSEFSGGPTQCKLHLRTDEGETIIMQLPENYNVRRKLLLQLKNVPDLQVI